MTTMGSSSSSSSNSLDLAPSALSKIEKFASVNGDVLFGFVEQYLIANNNNNNDEVDDSDDSPPPAPVNKLFETIFRLERHLVGRLPMPPGVSIVTLAEPA